MILEAGQGVVFTFIPLEIHNGVGLAALKNKVVCVRFPLDNNGNWQMWLEMLEFALIAKEPIPLLLIS